MTKERAQAVIRKHIENHGAGPMLLSKKVVRYWWRVLNYAVFDGKLQNAHNIQLFYSSKVFAWAIPAEDKKITLQIQRNFSCKTTFFTVLIHEMVHAWEYQTYGRMGHGKRFSAWRQPIRECTGLHLKKDINEYEHHRTPRNRNPHRPVEYHECAGT
jgi:hypothetical protein